MTLTFVRFSGERFAGRNERENRCSTVYLFEYSSIAGESGQSVWQWLYCAQVALHCSDLLRGRVN